MRRFLFNPDDEVESVVLLSGEESHHIARVLRLAVGTEIELFDGQGNLFAGEILETGRNVKVRLTARQQAHCPVGKLLWLYQADLKGKKMDFIIQKSTELGVDKFFPFTCSRSQGRSHEGHRRKKYDRWRKLVEGACKQSMRLTLMSCEEESSFSKLLHASDPDRLSGPKLLFWEEEQNFSLFDVDWEQPCDGARLMLGPEGGFSPEEISEARGQGWQTVSLGQQILRAETATIAAISIVQHHLGRI